MPGEASYSEAEADLFELCQAHLRRSSGHEVGAGGGLGERHDLADGVGAGQKHADAVEAEREAAHGGRTELEGVHQEAKLRLGTLLGKAQELEHGHLHLGVVDTHATATGLKAVHDKVVGARTHLERVLVQQVQLVGVGSVKG